MSEEKNNFYEAFGQPHLLYKEIEMDEDTGQMKDKVAPENNGIFAPVRDGENENEFSSEETETQDTQGVSKKEKRRKRDAHIIPQVEMQELNYWRTVAAENEALLRKKQEDLEQSYYMLQRESEARQHAEMQALAERESGLKFQKGVAELAGDRDFAEEAQQALIEAAVEKKLKDLQARSNPYPQEKFYSQEYQPSVPQRVASPLEQMREQAFYNFQSGNNWYGTDPNLTPMMNDVFSKLNSAYNLQGLSHEIGSPTYYDDAVTYFKKEFGMQSPSQPQSPPQQRQQYPQTAPVNRGQPTMADMHNQRTQNSVQLTPEDIKRLRSSNLTMMTGTNGEARGDEMIDAIAKNLHRVRQDPHNPYRWTYED